MYPSHPYFDRLVARQHRSDLERELAGVARPSRRRPRRVPRLAPAWHWGPLRMARRLRHGVAGSLVHAR